MARKIIKTVEDLIDEAGGYIPLSKIVDAPIWNVAKWKQQGIPRKFWDVLVSNLNISIAELHKIDMDIRDAK